MWMLLACTTPAWHGDRVVVSIDEDVVDFGAIPLGTTGSAAATLRNLGGAPAELELSVVGPFTVDRTTLDLGAGVSVKLDLYHTPTAYSGEVGTLHVFQDGVLLIERGLFASADPDSDADGHLATAAAGDDCDDLDPSVFPGAADTCYDGVDQDCARDDDDDCDQDGTPIGEDCDDTRTDVYPEAPEVDDGVDQDCDGRVDEAGIAVGDVVITEIHPAFPAWVELCATRATTLTGWSLDGLTISEAEVSAGGCTVLCERADEGCAGVLAFDLEETVDTLTLTADEPMDSVTWDATWPATSGQTRSLSGDLIDAAANDAAASWCISAGSPGSPNLPC